MVERVRAKGAQQGCDMASRARRHDRLTCGASGSTRVLPGHWGVSRFNCLYRGGKAALCCDTARDKGCDTAQERCDTHGSVRGMCLYVTIQFCVAVGGFRHGQCVLRHGLRHGRKGARYDAQYATTRPVTWQEGGHDTAPSAPRHGAQYAACARPWRSMRAAWALGVRTMHSTQF